MSYLVLARKYRPTGFSSVSGQEHVTRTLANALKRDRVVHAYLFTGPRGVGKTSVARILSKSLNCQRGLSAEPCLKCSACQEIASGTSLAVREVDGASHNSVDNVRDLIDSFRALPPPGYRYKVYIIDEVHMLSISAFNALLKSLEEPPPNTVFILATTEIHKIPETVVSRCQRHDFRTLSVSIIESRLREVVLSEGIDADVEAIRLVARLADGSMRDAQTLLDRVQSFCSGRITAQETSLALGTIDRRALVSLAQKVLQRDPSGVLDVVNEIFSTGTDPSVVLREFVAFWREIFVGGMVGESGLRQLGLSDDELTEVLRLVTGLEGIDLQDLWDLARDGGDRCLRSSHPRYGFEALVVRMATRLPVAEIAALIHDGGISTANASTAIAGKAVAQQVSNSARTEAQPSDRAPSAKQDDSAPLASSSVKNTAPSMDWDAFLRFVSQEGSRVLVENLKRLKISRFEGGTLQGTGPELSVSMVIKEKEKLNGLLGKFESALGQTPATSWRYQLVKGATAQDGVSVSKKPQSEELESHPAVQSLQKVFPGSKVDQVRVKP